LPAAIRVQLRDAATDRTLSVSTATLIHANMPADCVLAEVIADCLNRPVTPGQSPVAGPQPRRPG
jgi:general secretion pathway protein J